MKNPSNNKIYSHQDLMNLEKGRWQSPCYYEEMDRIFFSHIPSNSSILELGCGTGRLLSSLKPEYGLGIDKNTNRVEAARRLHAENKNLEFIATDAECIELKEKGPFDYIILSDLIPVLKDVQSVLSNLHSICKPSTRLILTFPSNLWRPVLKTATLLGLRDSERRFNWLSLSDVKNILSLSGFELITNGGRLFLPVRIPGLTWCLNRILAKIPVISNLCLIWFAVARQRPVNVKSKNSETVSVIIPTLNEKGNVEAAFKRIPHMGFWTEIIFVDGHSDDGTTEEIERCKRKYGNEWRRVKLLEQTGKGKGQAVRQGFSESEGDILMILDSDLTMPPEELYKYYDAITYGYGELVNGCRLIYPMEKQAMRFLNMIANHIFAKIFTWLLGQPIKDTLCGTKVLRRRDYNIISENRSYFGEFDPFGDFDLLFGAAKLNLKIVDLPIHYGERTYGEIKIQRWKHGFLLLRMCCVAFRKLKMT